jgi:hypothetical protein
MANNSENLPVVINTTDFFIVNPDRVKQGQMGSFVDGRWSPRGSNEVFPPGTVMLFRGMCRAVQGWHGNQRIGEYIETPNEPLPNVAELNAEIPKDTWDDGYNPGELRPPYARFWVVYATNKADGATYTFSNSTLGQSIAYDELKTKLTIDAAEGMRGIPEIELCSKLMKTARGPKQRPFFKVVRYFGNGLAQAEPIEIGATPPQTSAAVRQIERDTDKAERRTKPVKHETAHQEEIDEIDDSEPDVRAAPYKDED